MKIFIRFFPKNEEARVVIVNRVYVPAHGQGFYLHTTYLKVRVITSRFCGANVRA